MKTSWDYEDLKLQGFSEHEINLILEREKKLTKRIKEDLLTGKSSYKNNTPFLYLYVFKLMTDKIGMADQITTTKQLLEFWHRNIYNVPRKYDIHILNEMCQMGLLEKINTQKYHFYGERASNKLKKLRDNFLW